MQIRHLTGPALALAAFLPATAFADSYGTAGEIEMLKRENAQMREMMMQMQEQLQEVMAQTEAMRKQAAEKEAGEGEGLVKSKQENIVIGTTGGGIKVKSSNGNQFKIGGLLQFDHYGYDKFWNKQGDGGAEENEVRRSRVTLAGSSGKHWVYKFTVNIDHQGDKDWVDTGFLQYKNKPMYVKVGKFKRPGLMEKRTSGNWIATIERSILDELSSAAVGKPSFGGVEVGFAAKGGVPVSGALGIYDNEIDENDGGDEYGVGARISMAPKFGDSSFMHAGVSYYSVGNSGKDYRVRSWLGMRDPQGGARPFETNQFATDDIDQLGLELAYAAGPFSLQGEYMSVESDAAMADSSDIGMSGYYVLAAYSLTGEPRGYKSGSGVFTGLKPKGGMGAWELVARHEDADVDVKAYNLEASVKRTVLGVNWYPTRNVRMMLNYIDAEAKDCGEEDAEEARYNVAFKSCGYNGKDSGDGYSLRAQYAF